MLVTSQRASMADHNVDMASFLKRNQEHVDICQCYRIEEDKLKTHIPKHATTTLYGDEAAMLASIGFELEEDIVTEVFSSTSIYDEDE